MSNKSTVEFTLSHANSQTAAIVAAILNKPVEEIVSLCLEGSTNLNKA